MTPNGLERRLRAWYIASALIGALTGAALFAGYVHLSRSAHERASRHRRIVERQRDELRRLDVEKITLRAQAAKPCGVGRPDVVALLTRELSRAPNETEVERLLSLTHSFSVCEASQLNRIYLDASRRAAVDALVRLYLEREPDFAERFKYGYWLDTGLDVESVARDLEARSEAHSR